MLTLSQLQGQEGTWLCGGFKHSFSPRKHAHLEAPPEPYPRGADWQRAIVTAVSNTASSSVRSKATGLGSSFAQPPRDSYLLARPHLRRAKTGSVR